MSTGRPPLPVRLRITRLQRLTRRKTPDIMDIAIGA